MNGNENDTITLYPVMGFSDRLWWREALEEFGLPHAVAFVGWAHRYGAAMQNGEALDKVAARLISSGCPQTGTLQALRDVRRFCRRLARAYVEEEMGQVPNEREVMQHLRSFGVRIVV